MVEKSFEIRSGLERIEVRFEGTTTQIVVASAGAGRVSIDLDYRQLEDLVLGIMGADQKGMSGPRALMLSGTSKKAVSRSAPPRAASHRRSSCWSTILAPRIAHI